MLTSKMLQKAITHDHALDNTSRPCPVKTISISFWIALSNLCERRVEEAGSQVTRLA